ncbi:MAG: BamA/TamA family outer membrane protein [Ferruginibacter sp.]|nr:BamA/TamA family outer membrane protein [Ferruginibacter sp.]
MLIFFCCSLSVQVIAQQIQDSKNILLSVRFSDKDSSFNAQSLKLQSSFTNLNSVTTYINKLPALLASKGYPVASVDSSWFTDTSVNILLYLGTKYNWVKLKPVNIEKKALDESGFLEKNFLDKPINITQLQLLQQRLLDYYEREGYPFASVFLDTVQIAGDKIDALLKADKGILYHIDSIRVYGKVNIRKKFLQRYLNIFNGSVYNKEKLQLVDKRMLELPYLTPVQPSDLTMLGAGSVLNLYVKPKRSSQVNFLIGFLPGSGQSGKLQLTGDVNLDLKNMFGSGESILLKWQQLQQKSPRLNLGYSQPYIFNTAFGFDFLFDLFKKDSSFLQINAQLGLAYVLSANKTGKLFVQWQNTGLLAGAIDTNIIKVEKKLPVNIDISSVNIGLSYDWANTDYRYNPRKGNDINIVGSVGIKNIKRNNDITGIKDPSFNYASLYDSIKPDIYQFRVKLAAAHYFPLGKLSVFKAALQSGIYESPAVFRNELFQIGGYKLLRGFDEESIYATRYAVLTAEYRSLISLNSYFFFFVDGGMVKNRFQEINVNNNFFAAGLGLVYETKAGLLNISYALGKRNDVKFNFSNASKLHFGYVNYF